LEGFRLISLLEGISYLLILSVTLGAISRDYVSYLGMVHGVLFIVYLTLSIHASHQQKWSVITLLLLFLAAIIPFAFLFVELYIRKQLSEKQENSMV
jgi:integral membrane protein